jgi:enediyne biosynthesis protein E7
MSATALKVAPGPEEHFNLGASEESFELLRRYVAQYGDFFRVYSPERKAYTYLVSNPEVAKRVLLSNADNYTKGVGTGQIAVLLGHGVMTSEGEGWRRQRRMLQPSFQRRVLDRFSDLIATVNDEYSERWSDLAKRGSPLNLSEVASELTLEIMLRTIFGQDLAFIHERSGETPFSMVHPQADRDLKFAYRVRMFGKVVLELIAWRRAHAQEDRFDFLSMIMEARDKASGEGMTDKQLVDEVLTLIVAGHETSAATMSWAWYELDQHPDWQETLSTTASRLPSDRPLRMDETEAWEPGQQVVLEALRKYPPVWTMSRRAIGEDVLDGVPIAAGSDLFISPYFVHRHPEHWERVEEFDPTRFNAETNAARHRFAYIPFGGGHRRCIGEALAMHELTSHFATMSRRFRLSRLDDEPLQIEARINYRIRSDLLMQVERR